MSSGYEYKVVQVREGLIGGKMSGDKLEKILNDQASSGWQLKAITAVEVKGRIGPGGSRGSWSPSSARVADPFRILPVAATRLGGAG